MASNVVSQNSTNQPGNIVTPAAQNQTQAMVVQLPSGQTQITAPNTAAAQEAARAQLAAEQQQILHSGPVAQQAAPPVQTPSVAAQAPGQIQNVANLGQPAQQAPGYTVTTAQTSIPEVRPTTSQGVQSNSVPQTQDYAASLPQTNTTPSGQTASAQDRVNAVLNLSRQGITDPAQLQQYLNVTQAGSLPTNYTTQEIQQILNSNPQARPTQTAVASNAIQSSIQALQAIANTTPRTIANTNTLANLQNALTEANNGVVTSDLATNISNIIGSIVSNYQTLTLPQLPDYGAQLTAAQNEAQRLGAMVDDPSIDPAMQQMIALQAEQARNHISQIEDIQTRSQQQYDDQVQANKEADARAIVAMAGARLTGSPVAASYLTSVALAGRRALTQITQAQNQAINEANSAYNKDNIQLALEKIQLADKRRSQYFDLLDKQVNIEQNLYQAQTDRIKLQSDLQDQYEARKAKQQDFVSKQMQEYADKEIDPSVIPASFFQDYATKFGTTQEVAKALYTGSLRDQKAKTADAFNKNTEAFYKAAQSLPTDSSQVLYRPNVDGTFTAVKRSEINTNPDYDKFEVTKSGKNYAVYVDKNDPSKRREIELGAVDPKTTLKEDAFGNTIAITDNGDGTFTTRKLLDYAGNPAAPVAVTSTVNQLDASGNSYTQSNGTPSWTQSYPDGSVHQRGGSPAPECGQFVNDLLKTHFPDSLTGKEAQCDPTIGTAKNPVRIGDAVVTAEAAGTGHVAIINSIGTDQKGQYYVLTESNYKKNANGQGIVTNTRKIYANSPLIKGYGRGTENPATDVKNVPQLPADNKMSWLVNAPVGSPVMTAVKSGTIQDVTQVGQYKDGSPMYMVSVKDNDTGTITNYSGIKQSEVRIGSSWSSSEPAPSMGTTGNGGHTVEVRNGNNTPIAPTGEVDTNKYGTWGTYATIPPKVRPSIEAIRNDIEAGIDLDTAVKRVKSDPLLSQVSSDVVLSDLAGSYKHAQAQAREKADAKTAAADLKNQNKDYTQQDNLRKEVQGLQEVKDLKVTRDSYSIIDSLAKGRQKDGTLTGAGDMSLIFAYMKMLDPNSTVREGEFANAQNAGGVASTIQNTYNKILKGNRLTADQVETFKNEAKTLYDSKLRQVQPTIDYYKQLAEKRNFDPAEVIPDFSFKDGGSVGNSWTDPTSGITYTISN